MDASWFYNWLVQYVVLPLVVAVVSLGALLLYRKLHAYLAARLSKAQMDLIDSVVEKGVLYVEQWFGDKKNEEKYAAALGWIIAVLATQYGIKNIDPVMLKGWIEAAVKTVLPHTSQLADLAETIKLPPAAPAPAA